MIELVGGPHDGAMLPSGLRLPFLWTNGKRCFRAAARGRVLYRAMGDILFGTTVSAYRYIGHTHCVCVCGALRKKHIPCPLCGSDA